MLAVIIKIAGRSVLAAVNFADTVAGAARRSPAGLSNCPMIPSVKWLRALDDFRDDCACEIAGATAAARIATRIKAVRCMVSSRVGPAVRLLAAEENTEFYSASGRRPTRIGASRAGETVCLSLWRAQEIYCSPIWRAID